MPITLLITLITLGGVGVYLALPGGRMNYGRAALVVLVGAAATLVALVLGALDLPDGRGWFTAFALIGLFGAVRVVTHKRPVYSALYFVLVVLAVAAMMVLLDAEFLAAAIVIIYAGAILVTYVFVIMLAQQQGMAVYDRQAREPLIGCLAGFVLLALLSARLFGSDGKAAPVAIAEVTEAAAGTVENVGTHLLTQYVVGVEIAGVLLLAAMVGAIAVARRRASKEGEWSSG